MSVAVIKHIDVGDDGVARIIGQRTKVIQLVMDKLANGWTPEELQQQYGHLTLAQIHAAFAYYYDHQSELDGQIDRDRETAQRLRDQAGPSPIAEKLRGTGKLP